MAEVFKVEHRHLGQLRALKILLPEISAQPEIVSRLLAEARAMARLRHPGIVEVFDCDVLSDGTAFIAMEYLCGEPLRLWLERIGKLAHLPMLAAAIVGRVAEGLGFAHGAGVVHRDLKPENIHLVRDPGGGDAFSLKILDFGVAKMLFDEKPSLHTTRDGCIIGTPLYMAPEQWRPSHAIDHRTDIYALGCLFFELLTGRPPFLEQTDEAIMRAHVESVPPPVSSLVQGLPDGFDDLIARLLAKAPEERPQSIQDVLKELERLIGRPRTRWGPLLRTPAGAPVVAHEVAGTTTQPAVAIMRASPQRARASARWSRWGRTGYDPRARVALVACLGMLAASGLVGAVLLLTKEGVAQSPPTDPAPATAPPATTAAAPPRQPRITATPLPRRTDTPAFTTQVGSAPPPRANVVSD